jgi:hypothetical protein
MKYKASKNVHISYITHPLSSKLTGEWWNCWTSKCSVTLQCVTGQEVPIVWRTTPPTHSWTAWLHRHMHYYNSKWCELLTWRHNVTSQKTRLFCNAVEFLDAIQTLIPIFLNYLIKFNFLIWDLFLRRIFSCYILCHWREQLHTWVNGRHLCLVCVSYTEHKTYTIQWNITM